VNAGGEKPCLCANAFSYRVPSVPAPGYPLRPAYPPSSTVETPIGSGCMTLFEGRTSRLRLTP
jgi:hypothetical protein